MFIANKKIDGKCGAFIIAEIAQAHDGSLGLAHSFIDAAADSGADAVKFQTHIADAESTLNEKFRVPLSGQDHSRYEYWKRMEFSIDHWYSLSNHARERGLIFLSSPFSVEAAKVLNQLSIDAWKIGSGEVFNPLLMDYLIQQNQPLLVSTGMSSWVDIMNLNNHLHSLNREFAFFHCNSMYPTPLPNVGLNIIPELKSRCKVPIGLSDHSGSVYPSLHSLAHEIDLLEIHVTFDRRMYGPDTSSSLTFDELKLLCDANNSFTTLRLHPIDKDKQSSSLSEVKALFSKSLSFKETQPKGSIISESMLTLKKPAGGIPHESLQQLVGRRLIRDVPSQRLISWDDIDLLN